MRYLSLLITASFLTACGVPPCQNGTRGDDGYCYLVVERDVHHCADDVIATNAEACQDRVPDPVCPEGTALVDVLDDGRIVCRVLETTDAGMPEPSDAGTAQDSGVPGGPDGGTGQDAGSPVVWSDTDLVQVYESAALPSAAVRGSAEVRVGSWQIHANGPGISLDVIAPEIIRGDGDLTYDASQHVAECWFAEAGGADITAPSPVIANRVVFDETNYGPAPGWTVVELYCDYTTNPTENAEGDTVIFFIEPADIVAYNAEGERVPVEGNASFFNWAHIAPHGALQVRRAASPPSRIIVAGSSQVEVLNLTFTPHDEDFSVPSLRIMNCLEYDDSPQHCALSGDEEAVDVLHVSYEAPDGDEVVSSMPSLGPFDDFTGLDLPVMRDYAPLQVRIAVDAEDIGPFTDAESGMRFRLGILEKHADAIGTTSGTELDWLNDAFSVCDETLGYDPSGTCLGEVMVLRKSKPTIALSAGSPAGQIVPGGFEEIMRWHISADAAGPIAIEMLTVVLSDLDEQLYAALCEGSTALEERLKILDMDDPSEGLTDCWHASYCIPGERTVYINPQFGCGTQSGSEPLGIPAGATKTFRLEADLSEGAPGSGPFTPVMTGIHWSDGEASGIYGDPIAGLPLEAHQLDL